jgi:sugar-specific transcriptional regulator TrmB
MEIIQNRLTLVDMERRLLDDKTGEYRRSLLNKLEQYLSEMNTKLTAGLPPEEFNIVAKLKDSIESAKKVLLTFK